MMGSIRRFYSRVRHGEPIVVVSGLPRSGTSMMMQMVEAAGIEIGQDGIRTPDDDNPKGYYELEKIKELDKGGDKTWLRAYKGKAVKAISFLLRDLPDDVNYKVLFMVRDLDEILASQNKMLVHRGEDGGGAADDRMKQHYEKHLRQVRYLLEHAPNFEVLYVGHRDVVENPAEKAAEVARFLGGNRPVEKMTAAVNRKLYRNRA